MKASTGTMTSKVSVKVAPLRNSEVCAVLIAYYTVLTLLFAYEIS